MYTLYATDDNGQGFTQEIGKFDDARDIEVRIAMFSKDVVITIEEVSGRETSTERIKKE